MEYLLDVLRLLASIAIAFLAGKLIARLRLPSILGWLIAGMIIGPHALNLLGPPSWTPRGSRSWRASLSAPSA